LVGKPIHSHDLISIAVPPRIGTLHNAFCKRLETTNA
jgi:hypothetical protein